MPRKLDLNSITTTTTVILPSPPTTIRLAHKTELLKIGWIGNAHCHAYYHNTAQDSIVIEMYDTCWERKLDVPIEMFEKWIKHSPNNFSGYSPERILDAMAEDPTTFYNYIPDFYIASRDFPFPHQKRHYLTDEFNYSLWMFRVGSYSDYDDATTTTTTEEVS